MRAPWYTRGDDLWVVSALQEVVRLVSIATLRAFGEAPLLGLMAMVRRLCEACV